MSLQSVIISELVSDFTDPVLELIEHTYMDSFPEAERRPFVALCELLRYEPKFHVLALYREKKYVGFITYWLFNGFVYVEHFAVDGCARNGGVGATAMQQFLNSQKLPVVLEVEAPTDEISRRRIAFYERLGFVLDTHTYLQPPYRSGGDWVDLRLMTWGELDLSHAFESVKHTLYTHVYGVR